MNYDDYNDYELVSYVAENNEEAEKIILEKYKPLVYSMASQTFKSWKKYYSSLQFDELYRNALDALYNSIKTFNSARSCSFAWYSNICVSNAMKSFVTNLSNKKNMLNCNTYSLSDVDDCFLYNNSLFSNSSNPLSKMIDDENKKELYDNMVKNLSDFEKKVFDLRLDGYKNVEIMKILNIELKSVNNAFCRIRKKIKDNL